MLAIIPARGGSKGLPEKNIKPLLGKPLIAYTIEAAKKSKYITKIFVSTDCEKIAETAIKHGAECPHLRPEHLASDTALSIDTYKYVINKLNTESEKKVDEFVVLQPTSPLRNSTDIDNAVSMFFEKQADSVISYTPESHPISWHKHLDEENRFVDIFQEELKNRQDYKVSYYPNGAIYIFKSSIIEQNKYYTENSFAYILDKNKSIDIDTIDDFEYAEFLLKRMKSN
ncbi:MAG: N-acylneuraminate cytidylyltransferase [Flavobacteriales bacterium]|nr:N-acylneuraminate cytidylyltransferase [Flavobacteriales bacterium]|tara:strand:+ start:1752 stop:2435 length:684 start_codon:yes stop_codon:yes gene_type:complete